MTWARVFVVAAALGACSRSSSGGDGVESGSASADAGLTPGSGSVALSGVPTPDGPHPIEQGAEPPVPGSTAAPARPLPSSLTELGKASPLPMIEGEPTIAVVVERVSGGVMPDVERATSRLRAGMRACFLRSQGEVEDAPDASRLSLHIEVATNGSVKGVRPEGASGIESGAVDCIVRRAQSATFPTPVGAPAEIVLRIAFLPPQLR